MNPYGSSEIDVKLNTCTANVADLKSVLLNAITAANHSCKGTISWRSTDADDTMVVTVVDSEAKPEPEEERIYVIVPKTVQVMQADGDMRSIVMEPGRLMAQCAHVVSRMRFWETPDHDDCFTPLTTIVLSARNSRELHMLRDALYAHNKEQGSRFTVYGFEDTNAPFYGAAGEVTTAICTSPVKKSQVDQVIGHLELYS